NFSYADIRGADFSGAILREANFSHVKAGLRFSGLLLIITVSLIIIVVILVYLTSSMLSKADSTDYGNPDTAKNLAMAMGAIVPIVGMAIALVTEIWLAAKSKVTNKILVQRASHRWTVDQLVLIVVTVSILVTSICTVIAMKDLMAIWDYTKASDGKFWISRGSLMEFSPYDDIAFSILAVLLGIVAGSQIYTLIRYPILRGNSIWRHLCLVSLVGILGGAEFGYGFFLVCIVLIILIVFILCIPLQVCLGLINVITKGHAITAINEISIPSTIFNPYFTFIVALLGLVALRVGKKTRWRLSASFLIAFFTSSLAREGLGLNPELIAYCIALFTALIYSFVLALATERTNFQKADLTDANFTKAKVKYADFTNTKG
ncbi:pentapeptide repeat-containing protein, partial [Crocosphaera chwakensis]